MKHYKLLKDLPTFKAGDLFYISEYGALVYVDGGYGVMAYAQSTLDRFPNILKEWFEEIKEPTDSIHWKPKNGDNYFYIVHSYSPLHNEVLVSTWIDDDHDKTHYLFGNIYRSYEEAEKARNRKLAEVRLRRTSTFKPDFENGKGGWIVYYDHGCETLAVCDFDYYDDGEIVRYKTREEAEKSIEENREDWLTYFGVKEKN
nr:MAG TPA: hypothetical protein [Caudoviricetes sp.]